MAVPQDRAALIAALKRSYAQLSRDLAAVPLNAARLAVMEGHRRGSMMSPADLLAYLLGWNRLVLKWLDRDEKGLPIDLPETGYRWNALGALTEKFYRDYEQEEWVPLCGALRDAYEEILSRVTGAGDDRLYGQSWYGRWTLGRMIQLNTVSPYENAHRRLRRFTRQAVTDGLQHAF